MAKVLGRQLVYLIVVANLIGVLAIFMAGCAPEEKAEDEQDKNDLNEYQVEIQADPEEAGEIIGEGTYEEGEEITVEATPKEGYEFIAWEKEGDQLSTDKQHKLEMTEDKNLMAIFEKQTAEHELDHDLPEEIEQLLVKGEEDKIDGGILDLGEVLEKTKEGRVAPLKTITHLVVEDELIQLEEMIITRQLDEEAPILAEHLEKANIKWYYNDEKLFSIEDLYSVLEDDWSKIICPTILEYQGVEGYLGDNPEEANPHYFNGIGAIKISPSEEKIAFDLDNYGACVFRIGAAGIISLKDEQVYFTNIGWGDLAFEKKWSPDEEHIAYISSSDGPSGDWLHVDSIKRKENLATLDVEEINPVLDQEGFNTLSPREPGISHGDMSWSDDGSALKFSTDFTYASWEEVKESELKKIQWQYYVETEELKIESVIKNGDSV